MKNIGWYLGGTVASIVRIPGTLKAGFEAGLNGGESSEESEIEKAIRATKLRLAKLRVVASAEDREKAHQRKLEALNEKVRALEEVERAARKSLANMPEAEIVPDK